MDATSSVKKRGRLPGQRQSRCPHGRLMHQLLGAERKKERWRRGLSPAAESDQLLLFSCSLFASLSLSLSFSCSRQLRVLTMASDTACDSKKCDLHIWFFSSHFAKSSLMWEPLSPAASPSLSTDDCLLFYASHTCFCAYSVFPVQGESERQEKFKCKK